MVKTKYDKNSMVNNQNDWGPTWPFEEHKNLYSHKTQDIHLSSDNHEESGDGLDLHLLTISY